VNDEDKKSLSRAQGNLTSACGAALHEEAHALLGVCLDYVVITRHKTSGVHSVVLGGITSKLDALHVFQLALSRLCDGDFVAPEGAERNAASSDFSQFMERLYTAPPCAAEANSNSNIEEKEKEKEK
jgi:hypothetical protein